MSGNPNLSSLTCSGNSINSLNVSANTGLFYLDCNFNDLSSLDLSFNTSLQSLHIASNNFTSIDVLQNSNLLQLICDFNELTSLDISQNPLLVSLNCVANQITSLDLSSNLDLEYLYCTSNNLTELDISLNTKLIDFYCDDNQIQMINAASNIELHNFVCDSNQLECLNLKNGINNTMLLMSATNNPNLTCIQVDDVSYSSANWTNVDNGPLFSLDCGSTCTVSINLKSYETINLHPNPSNSGIIRLKKIENLSNYIIYNSIGVEVQSGTLTKVIDIGLLAPGVYHILLKGNTTIFSSKFIVK